MKYITLASVGNYLIYAVLGILLLTIFTRLYIWFTPYNELDEMRKGKKAPAFALGGAMLGFTFPIMSMAIYGVNAIDFLIWSAVGGLVQATLFKILYRIIPMDLDTDNQAIGIFYAFVAICVGLINSVSLIPS